MRMLTLFLLMAIETQAETETLMGYGLEWQTPHCSYCNPLGLWHVH